MKPHHNQHQTIIKTSPDQPDMGAKASPDIKRRSCFMMRIHIANRYPLRCCRSGLLPGWALRTIVPGAALGAFGTIAVLWVFGFHGAYFGLLQFLGVQPFRFPFLDIHAVLSAAQCNRYGLDVHVSNPCDALGRIYIYSPLWLTLTPHWLGTADTGRIGILLDLAFLASLAFVIRPRSLSAVTILAFAVFSPTTVFALERANNDLVIFLSILCASTIDGGAPVRRGLSYFLYLIAGLLKYYPLVLLVLLVRNSHRAALLYGGAMLLIVLAVAVYCHNQIYASLASIPKASCVGSKDIAPSYYGYAFTAKNLPFGISCNLGNARLTSSAIAIALLLLLMSMTVLRIWQNLRALEAADIDWDGGEMQRLAIGSILIAACFFAGTNIAYRGIYFLFVIPGLVRLHLATTDAPLRRWCSWLITVILLLMWEQFIRLRLAGIGSAAIWFAAWLVYELLWWWLIAALVAIAISYLRRQPLSEEGAAVLRRLRLRFSVH